MAYEPEFKCICRLITEAHGECEDIVFNRSRVDHIVKIRQLAFFLMRELTAASLSEIGNYLNYGHHNVIHAQDKVMYRLERDSGLVKLVLQIKSDFVDSLEAVKAMQKARIISDTFADVLQKQARENPQKFIDKIQNTWGATSDE